MIALKTPLKSGKLTKVAAILVGAMLVSACTTMQKKTPEEAVAERAQLRWGALMARDFDKAYAFTSPSYRALAGKDQFRAGFGAGGWSSAKVLSVTCASEKCGVKVRIEIPSPMPTRFRGNLDADIDETWVFEDDQWWYNQKI